MNIAQHKIKNIINTEVVFSVNSWGVGDICIWITCTQDTHTEEGIRVPGTAVACGWKLPDLDAGSLLMEEQVLLTTRPHFLQLRKFRLCGSQVTFVDDNAMQQHQKVGSKDSCILSSLKFH